LNQAEGGGDYWDDTGLSFVLGVLPVAAAVIAGWLAPAKPRKLVDVLLFASLFGLMAGIPVLALRVAASNLRDAETRWAREP
jgi:hypothetical protein